MCLYTKYVLNPKYKPNKKNNYRPQKCEDERLKYVPVSCGRCIECRKKKKREWLVRLSEEIKNDNKCMFVTLTFSDKGFNELSHKVFNRVTQNDEEENQICIKAVRMWLERIRAKSGKSVKHWLITEKGEDFGRIHLHGIVWADTWILKDWGYGYVSHGTYVNEQTINYITKYVTKVNEKFRNFIGKVLASKGIGKVYIDKNKGSGKADEYRTRKGYIMNLPDYYRRNIYSDKERERLWIENQERGYRYICGEKVSTENLEEWENLTRYYQERAKRLYKESETEWEADKAKKRLERMRIARAKYAVNKAKKSVNKSTKTVDKSVKT